ncbi:putative bifunctional diguanylate cyclase/phosphodiesterase [Oceanisphaera sp. W20_SRM_FM3]|uniref:putative bifunctional diguanylate cyclase/phosphodiesterase n=1 Tax=Oceanisphaera sp. W20_SRM_FM3 TaxID=3240267 RepID=UPI003F9DB142
MPHSTKDATIDYLHLLKEVAVAANKASDVETALFKVLQSVCQAMKWPLGHSWIKRPDGELVSSGIWYLADGYPAEQFAAFRQASEQRGFCSGVGLPGRVLSEGVSLKIIDIELETNFLRQATAREAGLVSGFAVPVQSGHSITAVLEFFTRAQQPLLPELLDVMTQVGVQLGRVFERQSAQQALLASEQRSRQIIDSAADAFIGMNSQGMITAWNRAAEVIFGWSLAEVLGQSVGQTIVPSQHREAHQRGLARFLGNGESQVLGQRLELPALHRDGREFPIEITLWSLQEHDSWSFFAFAHDISARKQAEQALEYRALHDVLTGLPNRALALERLQLCLAQSEQSNAGVTVLFIDLDYFKRINDSFGHDAGDQVLITVAQRLQRAMRPHDTVARLAGDEFVIVCPNVASHSVAAVIAERLLAELAPPITLGEDHIFISASIGIAIAESGWTAEKLIGSADIAMYEAKSAGRAHYQLFDEQMQMQVSTQLRIENELHRALERQEFRLFFQPIVAATTGQLVSVEALLRWQHPVRGLLSPLEFIGIAEASGLIVPIGTWVIEESCRLAQHWDLLRDTDVPLGISVNLSPRQLLQSDLVDTVLGLFHSYAFDPKSIEFTFEVTETAVMRDPEAAAIALQALRDLGAYIAIDDFGTGYSSLAYLKQFPVDKLKIDRSFITEISESELDQAIVRAVIGLGHAMKLAVVAEGVETQEQACVLQSLDIDLLQGYFYGRPQPATQLEALLLNTIALTAWDDISQSL